jgi:CheY-like chemotaxis protein
LHVARVNDYISKPFTPQDLVESVERVLANQRATRLPPE